MALTITVLVFAFLLGSIPFGLIIAKSKGINIREHGSGNIGATNVLRVVGKKFGITCFFLDFFKGLIPVILGINLIRFPDYTPIINLPFLESYATVFNSQLQAQSLQILAALLPILGHNYSPWVGFKGGKGIATSAGALVPLMPMAILILLIIWFVTFKISRYVSLASMVAAGALPFLVIYGSWKHGKLQSGEWNKPLFIFACFIGLMAIWKHRSNIKNLLNGTESRFTKKSKTAK
ncbi:glycerol-3-phosphate 1-O-acyltransferase PlsY [Akkermansiaceae bacterium]|nr:glycerol-3-phosphate 1-O-acyltransferase PlsY [Akkermansiaceae bacterium]